MKLLSLKIFEIFIFRSFYKIEFFNTLITADSIELLIPIKKSHMMKF